jgi:hypothetical protein
MMSNPGFPVFEAFTKIWRSGMDPSDFPRARELYSLLSELFLKEPPTGLQAYLVPVESSETDESAGHIVAEGETALERYRSIKKELQARRAANTPFATVEDARPAASIKSAERFAGAIDEAMSFGVALAINLAEEKQSRDAADHLVFNLKIMRLLSVDLIERMAGVDAKRLIYVPEMPEVGTLDFEQPGPKPAA